jgi:hypothetical protein
MASTYASDRTGFAQPVGSFSVSVSKVSLNETLISQVNPHAHPHLVILQAFWLASAYAGMVVLGLARPR